MDAECCCCCETPKVVKIRNCRCGGHKQLESSLYETIKNAGTKCTQFFLGGATDYYCARVTKKDKEITRQYCTDENKTFYVHCPLILNLAKNEVAQKGVTLLKKEIEIVHGLPGACVLHIGKVGTIENVATRINELNLSISSEFNMGYDLLLEVAAGQGTELGKNLHEIRHLYEAIDRTRVGLCVDTQHIFASGVANLQSHESVVELFDFFDSISPKILSLIHINDSARDFASRVDRHAPLCSGYIWRSQGLDGLHSILDIATDKSIDLISETSDPISDINYINTYIKSL